MSKERASNIGTIFMAAAAKDRGVWWPEYDTEVVQTIGQEWPDLIVTKWESNYLGEKRFVETKVYSVPA